jgi:folate-dependent phosphoribosylglycinamide formyltransferase PurN
MPNETLQSKRLVIITCGGPEHIYVSNALTRQFDIAAILLDTRQHKPNVRRALKKGLGVFLTKVSRALFLKLISAGKKNHLALLNILFDGKQSTFDRRDLLINVHNINSAEAADQIDKLQPDALLVYGTPIVKDHILHRAKDTAFNMHTGISPFYRGTACTLWPIVEQEPERLGATLHECTSAVDGGQIFATRQSRIEENDGLYEAFGRAVVVGAELYTEVVQQYLDGTLKGVPQNHSLGREYRGVDLTVITHIRARWSVLSGTLRRYARSHAN